MATRNLTIEFKYQFSRNQNFINVFTDAQIEKAYKYLDTTVPYDGFVAGDKLRGLYQRIVRGGVTNSTNAIRAFLSQFDENDSIDDSNIQEQYDAVYATIDEWFEYISNVTTADKTTPV